MSQRPRILFIGGHDPSGGAGIQADIETALAHHCRASSLITCLTTQDSSDVRAIHPQDPAAFEAQLELLLADGRPDMVKIGLLGSAALGEVLARRLPGLPLVLDPVLAAGGGRALSDPDLEAVIREQLLPRTLLLTPNHDEARRLGDAQNPTEAARALLKRGCRHVLLTGTDGTQGSMIRHQLLSRDSRQAFEQARLPGRYHGSGCTLASACACRLARGLPMPDAVARALDWTWRSLLAADRPGQGQHLPWRGVPSA